MELFLCQQEVNFPESGKLDVRGTTWGFSADFVKSSGTLTISQTNLGSSGNSTLTSDMALSFVTLNLSDSKLTLGSSTSDLTVINAITSGQIEGILTGEADLLLSALTFSAGDVTSTGGTINFSGGGQLSGTGKLDVSGSIQTLGDDFTKYTWNSDYVTNNLKIRRQQHIDK